MPTTNWRLHPTQADGKTILCLFPAAWLSSAPLTRPVESPVATISSPADQDDPMADYTKYDPRVDSLVMESLTSWDPSVGKLSDEDKSVLARLVHRSPEKAAKVSYFRSHTGFTREITVTVDDIARIYNEQTAARA